MYKSVAGIRNLYAPQICVYMRPMHTHTSTYVRGLQCVHAYTRAGVCMAGRRAYQENGDCRFGNKWMCRPCVMLLKKEI